MDNWELLKLAENQDVEAYNLEEFEKEGNSLEEYKRQYTDFYDDIKQNSKYIKEDW